MDKFPKRFILIQLSNCRCNLRCPYCYITARKLWDQTEGLKFQYPIKHMIDCLSKERLGGVALINLTGLGETLLQEGIVEFITGLLEEGHYLEVVTNGTVQKKIRELLCIPENYLERLEFKISFHYQELKRLKLLDNFFKTVDEIRRSKASFTLELMPNDELEKDIPEIIKITTERVGAKPQVTIGRADEFKDRRLLTKHTEEEYRKIWSVFESEMFDLKMNLLGKKCKGFCYAGMWSLFVEGNTGNAYSCYGQPSNQNIFKDINRPIRFEPVGYYCTEPYCINGHAHLTMGLVPQIKSPTFAQIRNRVTEDGSEWMKESCKSGFSTKLYTTNPECSKWQKIRFTIFYPMKLLLWCIKRPRIAVTKLGRFFKLKR